jgi:hemoglobin/transferrin/lactoferrin receptor protein
MLRITCALALAAIGLVIGPLAAADALSASASPADARRLSDDLIYSVDRMPERTFETSRAVQVINADAIHRANAAGLADLLEEQAGIIVSATQSGGAPIVRGLAGKQVMLLVDGVKVNNASWGGVREYLNLINLDQVDRIEIVRGVVSVLGTESLGGVINVITKKGPGAQGKAFGGSIGARYAGSGSSLSLPIELFGRTERFRFDAGVSAMTAGDLQGGGSAGRQKLSGFHQRSGYLNGQWLLSPEKTLGFGYQIVQQHDVEAPGIVGLFNSVQFTPRELQLGNVSYQDLASRGWEDSLRVTGYWNRQSQIQTVNVAPRPAVNFSDGNIMTGLNVEVGSFLGAHHLLYGIDTSTDSISSSQTTHDAATGALIVKRGNEMDGATYRTLGIYLQDHVDLSKWLTVIAGARYGQFESKGIEHTDIGVIDLNSKKGDVTGALNLIGHVTPRLNVIANAFRGFRAPNIDDTSKYNYVQTATSVAFEVPTPNAQPERVISFEAGLKYEDGRLGGSAFFYRNKLTDLLILAPGTFNGLTFRDTNGDHVRQPSEFLIYQNQNVGSATIRGIELDGHYTVTSGVTAWGHFTQTVGTDTAKNKPLSAMPPPFGTAGVRYSSGSTYRPWTELVWRYYGSQDRLSSSDLSNPDVKKGSLPGFNIFHIRGGVSVTERFSVTAALQNVLDKKYREVGSSVYAPGRELVLGTQYRF